MKEIKLYGRIFTIEEIHNRFFLFLGSNRIAELMNGQDGLDKYYNGSFEKWIEKIKNRDMRRINNISNKIWDLNSEIDSLKTRWNVNED